MSGGSVILPWLTAMTGNKAGPLVTNVIIVLPSLTFHMFVKEKIIKCQPNIKARVQTCLKEREGQHLYLRKYGNVTERKQCNMTMGMKQKTH